MILIILLLIALFHLFLYYWNLDLKTMNTKTIHTKNVEPIVDLTETKTKLEKHLNELKQYNRITKNG